MGDGQATALKEPGRRRHGGLDLLRVLAMAIVVVQHGLTAVGHYDWTMLTATGITIGQFGVSIFCALSGWFALSDNTAPAPWLLGRMAKLYPAYWIATIFAFGLAVAMGRPVTFGLFFSQMAGLGFFTHGWNLVNVVSWFISLILLCYALATVARFSKHPQTIMTFFCAVAVCLVAARIEISLSRHVLAFAAASIAGARRQPKMLLIFMAMLAPFVIFQPSFIYATAALPILWAFYERVSIRSVVIAAAANHAYEFFLLHGMFLAGAWRLLGSAPLAIVLGIGATFPAAILLKDMAKRFAPPFFFSRAAG
jgi:peptidoglycan/LPS O-acetylase OafA/YrhL